MPAPDLTMDVAVRRAFLTEQRVLRLATVDDEGWPVVVPLWFVHHDDDRGELWIWNLNRARRTRRLEAGGRCAVTIDAGHGYDELHGLSVRALPHPGRGRGGAARGPRRLRAQVLRIRRAARTRAPSHVVRARAVRRAQLGLPPTRRVSRDASRPATRQ
jgi:hypothetical protein